MRGVRLGYRPIKNLQKRVIIPEVKGEEGDAHNLCRVLSIKVLVFVDRRHI